MGRKTEPHEVISHGLYLYRGSNAQVAEEIYRKVIEGKMKAEWYVNGVLYRWSGPGKERVIKLVTA
ncbi:MAG TPA: hypothetical protein ENN47_03780 [Mesotoga infera]|uniref:Uncharacterized protein n=1 Tax=Mesotoga infera TaxID=1236046 RepID=A0A7C1GSF1_9BACT|nr:hypothetical protein [Mesotoga infera]